MVGVENQNEYNYSDIDHLVIPAEPVPDLIR